MLLRQLVDVLAELRIVEGSEDHVPILWSMHLSQEVYMSRLERAATNLILYVGIFKVTVSPLETPPGAFFSYTKADFFPHTILWTDNCHFSIRRKD